MFRQDIWYMTGYDQFIYIFGITVVDSYKYIYIDKKLFLTKATWNYSINPISFPVSLYLAAVEYCNECFHMTKIILATNAQTVCNIKAKPSSHISVHRSELLDLGLRSLTPGHWFCFLDFNPNMPGGGGVKLTPPLWFFEKCIF